MSQIGKGMVGSLLVLICFYLGTWLSHWAGLPFPGALTGLIILLIVLFLMPSLEKSIALAVSPLLVHMSILFVPAVLGVSVYWQQIQHNAWALGIAIIVTTSISLGVTAKIAAKLFATGMPSLLLSSSLTTRASGKKLTTQSQTNASDRKRNDD